MPHVHPIARFSLYIACLWALISAIAQAQILPDSTLGAAEASQLFPDVSLGDEVADVIAGGAERGANLFHSFTQFNVNNGQTVYFFSPTGIQTIFARVTGGPSTILGTLGTINIDNSPTNLFLLNPNGIIFGPNAQILVPGSFLATTASHIKFPEGNFSATQPSAPPLLTVSVPIGLGFETAPAPISAQSALLFSQKTMTLVGGDIEITNSNLLANNHKLELAAIGGAGTIGLNLSDADLRLALLPGLPRANVALQDGSRLSAGDTGAGSIQVTAKNLTLTDRSQIRAGIFNSGGTIETQAKDIVLDVSDRTVLKGQSAIYNSVLNDDGNGGNIVINTSFLEVLSGSNIDSLHNGNGDSGNIVIRASEDVTFQGEAPGRSFPTLSSVKTSIFGQGFGDAGSLEITARNLNILDGAVLDSSSERIGKAGNIRLNIQDKININGTSSNPLLVSGISSAINPGAQGQGGDISIATGSLKMTNGATIDSTLFGEGSAGNITINALDSVVLEGNIFVPRLGLTASTKILTNVGSPGGIGQGGEIRINARSLAVVGGATIDSSVLGIGKGGTIVINTQENTTVAGEGIPNILPSGRLQSSNSTISSVILPNDDRSAQNKTIRQGGAIQIVARDLQVLDGGGISTFNGGIGDAGNIEINTRDRIQVSGKSRDGSLSEISSSIFAGQAETAGGLLTVQAVGRAGNIQLTTDRLSLQEGLVSAFSLSPTGAAGNVDIRVRDLFLDRARIRTDSTSGNGGNLTITANNLLLLRRDSQITASAGTRNLGGNGGNIKISTTNLVSVPRENSDITANAFTGNGGNISLTTTGLLGIKPQPKLTPFSDITASSAQGVQGTISVTQPDLRPEQGLTELPNDIIDSSNQISPTCPRPGTTTLQGRFTATGRGSLPPTPLDGPSPSLTLPPLAKFEKSGKDAIAQPSSKQRAIALARLATSCGIR
ncbi:MAG: S-layer family protein [Alkalinema sp. RU_4_3]|nr:S-layer family protein [Alkalinema sp. RU_4_3]